jgi:hypothetical protein
MLREKKEDTFAGCAKISFEIFYRDIVNGSSFLRLADSAQWPICAAGTGNGSGARLGSRLL